MARRSHQGSQVKTNYATASAQGVDLHGKTVANVTDKELIADGLSRAKGWKHGTVEKISPPSQEKPQRTHAHPCRQNAIEQGAIERRAGASARLRGRAWGIARRTRCRGRRAWQSACLSVRRSRRRCRRSAARPGDAAGTGPAAGARIAIPAGPRGAGHDALSRRSIPRREAGFFVDRMHRGVGLATARTVPAPVRRQYLGTAGRARMRKRRRRGYRRRSFAPYRCYGLGEISRFCAIQTVREGAA